MARYTTRDIEEIIASSDLAENKKAGYARDSKNPDVWKRAGIQPRQTGAGQTGSASSSANVKTASGNTSDSQMLSNIRKYTQKGYKNLNDSERAEMDSIMDAVSQSTSDAINNYSGEWDFSKAVLPGGTEFSGDDYDAYMKYWTDRSNERSAGNSGKTHLADEAFVKSALYNFPGAKQFARFWEEHIDPILGTNLVDSDALAEEMAQIQEDQKVASTAGALGGNLAGYYLGAKFAEAIPVLGGAAGQAANSIANAATRGQMSQQAVQAGAKHIQNVLGDMTLDVTLDTLPQLVGAAQDGASAGDVAGLAAESTLQNLAINAGGELFGMAAPAALNRLRRANDSVSDRAAQQIPFLRNQATQEENVEIPRLRDRIDQMGDLSALGGQTARTGTDTAESVSRAAAETIPEAAARQADNFVDMANVNDMYALDFA